MIIDYFKSNRPHIWILNIETTTSEETNRLGAIAARHHQHKTGYEGPVKIKVYDGAPTEHGAGWMVKLTEIDNQPNKIGYDEEVWNYHEDEARWYCGSGV